MIVEVCNEILFGTADIIASVIKNPLELLLIHLHRLFFGTTSEYFARLAVLGCMHSSLFPSSRIVPRLFHEN
jgi:hypothetical protein